MLTEDTADMTMALMLAVPRRLTEGANVLDDAGEWAGWSPTWMLGRRIWGKRLGIVGMGRIGTAVARRAKAFGLSIHYHNRHRVLPRVEDELEATYWESLDQMLARMDIISVNCPSTPATFHLLSARRLALMQPHGLPRQHGARRHHRRGRADQAAAGRQDRRRRARRVRARAGGQSRSCSSSPPRARSCSCRIWARRRIEGRIDMGEKVIINIRTFFDGHRPPDRVLPLKV